MDPGPSPGWQPGEALVWRKVELYELIESESTLRSPLDMKKEDEMNLKVLVGSGSKIGLFALPFILIGIGLNIWQPSWFSVGGPTDALRLVSLSMLVPGIIIWAWSVYLILTKIPAKQLITSGPFALMKHPLYTGVALLVLPWFGFICNSWLGVIIGGAFYLGRLLFAPEEEKILSKIFGSEWDNYAKKVILPWL
jgi:protein-S-isoprenylcysteine O-methyltransferase Ste14